jgi:uncharacterized protein with NRDE domain
MFGGMCTVMLRLDPGGAWPLLLAAVRDEFMQRAWDAPAAHWPEHPSIVGGRDRTAGGTWMAVDVAGAGPSGVAVAALLNGVRLPEPADGARRPTRGRLVLTALSDVDPIPGDLDRYDGFHLLRADAAGAAEVWSWDGAALTHRRLAPGDHIIVNLGIDRDADPLVPHFRPLLEAQREPAGAGDTATAWGGWVELLRGDGLDPADERGLIIEHEYGGLRYGSTSASLVGLTSAGSVRYDFTATPSSPAWSRVWPVSP